MRYTLREACEPDRGRSTIARRRGAVTHRPGGIIGPVPVDGTVDSQRMRDVVIGGCRLERDRSDVPLERGKPTRLGEARHHRLPVERDQIVLVSEQQLSRGVGVAHELPTVCLSPAALPAAGEVAA